MKQTIKQTLAILLVIFVGSFTGQRIFSQEYLLIGSDICSDGSQSTHISLSDSDPANFYALYRDGQFLEVKSLNSEKGLTYLFSAVTQNPENILLLSFPGQTPILKNLKMAGRSKEASISTACLLHMCRRKLISGQAVRLIANLKPVSKDAPLNGQHT